MSSADATLMRMPERAMAACSERTRSCQHMLSSHCLLAYAYSHARSGLVTFIAAYHYIRIFNSWVESYEWPASSDGTVLDPTITGVPFNDAYRYMDWLLTVPLLLIEIIFVMKLSPEETASKATKLGVASGLMIILGYPGELIIEGDLSVRWMWWTLAMIPFMYVVYTLLVGLSGAIASESDPAVAAMLSKVCWATVLSWCTYPVVYVFPMLGIGGPMSVVAIQMGYCTADVISKYRSPAPPHPPPPAHRWPLLLLLLLTPPRGESPPAAEHRLAPVERPSHMTLPFRRTQVRRGLPHLQHHDRQVAGNGQQRRRQGPAVKAPTGATRRGQSPASRRQVARTPTMALLVPSGSHTSHEGVGGEGWEVQAQVRGRGTDTGVCVGTQRASVLPVPALSYTALWCDPIALRLFVISGTAKRANAGKRRARRAPAHRVRQVARTPTMALLVPSGSHTSHEGVGGEGWEVQAHR